MSEQQLHDRATRGEPLSADERARLVDWYARLDQEEAASLNPTAPPASLAVLQAQVKATLAQLATLTEQIQTQTAENAALRREIAALQAQLAQKLAPQSA